MKNLLYTAFLLLLFSCKEQVTLLPLQFQGFDGKMAIIAPSGVLKIKMNQPVKWRITSGTVSQGLNDTLTYTAPTTAGVQQVIIKPQNNSADSLLLTVAVSPSAALFNALRAGNHVLIFRHAFADVGTDQNTSSTPEWWKSCDSQLARQLSNQGLSDATNTGKTFKLLDIPVGRVVSSEYCRALTTAEKMATGLPVQPARELTLLVYDELNRCDNTLKLAASQPRDGKNALFITHIAFVINQPDCTLMNGLQSGDAALFSLNANKTLSYAGRIPVKDWTDLGK